MNSLTASMKLKRKLGYPDSNQKRQDQNLQCYHYTIPQTVKFNYSLSNHESKTSIENLVGVPGLEPGKAGPESAVLPLHHTPNCGCKQERLSRIRVQNYGIF